MVHKWPLARAANIGLVLILSVATTLAIEPGSWFWGVLLGIAVVWLAVDLTRGLPR